MGTYRIGMFPQRPVLPSAKQVWVDRSIFEVRFLYNIFADITILVHFLFIIFVIGGGLLVIRKPVVAFFHLPAVVWGAVVEICSFTCPLTPLENYFRRLAGQNEYGGDFLAQYLLALIYPENLTPALQKLLGGLVILINIVFYTLAVKKYRSRKHRHALTGKTL